MTDAAAIAAAVLFGGVVVFQLALAAGAPWGQHAYGGRFVQPDGTLPNRHRLSSLIASFVLIGFAWIVLVRAGIIGDEAGFTGWAIWLIVAFLALNTAGNLASESRIERVWLGSATAVLVVLCVVVAVTGP